MLVLASAPAAAQGLTILSQTDSRTLAAYCTSADFGQRSFCDGYLTATLDQLSARGAICIAPTMNYDALRAAVVRYLQQPDQARIHASVSLQRALTSSIPCPQSPRNR